MLFILADRSAIGGSPRSSLGSDQVQEVFIVASSSLKNRGFVSAHSYRAVATGEIPRGTRFVWDEAERRLEAQIRQADALDTKAAALVGVHAFAAGLAATIVGDLRGFSRWVGLASLVILLTSGGLAVLAFRN